MSTTYKKPAIVVSTSLIVLSAVAFSIGTSKQATAIVVDDVVTQEAITLQNESLVFENTQQLREYFASNNFRWPIASLGNVPTSTLQILPKDINQVSDVKLRKSLFIRIMLPIIYAEQEQIREIRRTVLARLDNMGASAANDQWFKQLLKEYNVVADDFSAQRTALLERIDELPTALILAQAALESGWGTSRFAIEGNSVFGQWTFNKGDGLVPENREAGKNHQVKAFDSLQASVRSYIKNINRNRAYKELRDLRTVMRENGQPLDSALLAEGLQRYSQKGKGYVVILHKILRSDDFKIIQSIDAQRV